MASVDELLKLKELLDNNIITQEEFEKKKAELLSQNKNDNIVKNSSIFKKEKKKEKNKIKLSTLILAIIIVGIIIAFTNNTTKTPSSYTNKKLLTDEYSLSQEEATKIIEIIDNCGYSNYYSNYKLEKGIDNNEIENSICFEIKSDGNIVGYIDIKDNSVYKIQYSDKILYENGAIQHTLSEYINITSSNTEKFTLISSEGNKDSYGYITITGEIKNNTNKTYTYAQVTFTLYDESGAQVGTAMDNINNFEANGTWKFKAIGLSNGSTTYKCTGITGW